jgi:hypothetical protein
MVEGFADGLISRRQTAAHPFFVQDSPEMSAVDSEESRNDRDIPNKPALSFNVF